MFLFKAAVTEIDRLRCQSMVDSLTRELESRVDRETKQLDGKNPLEMFAQWEEDIIQKYDKAMLPSTSETWGDDNNSTGINEATISINEKAIETDIPTQNDEKKAEEQELKEGEVEEERKQKTKV